MKRSLRLLEQKFNLLSTNKFGSGQLQLVDQARPHLL